jgi:hypothetical protein
MKRQHPDNPDLFWCPKCEGYFPLTGEYWYWRNDSQEWRPFCKICHLKNRHKYESTCINCGKKFDATLGQIKKRGNIFCSHGCRTKEFISDEALSKMAATQIKKGERKSTNTEFKKGSIPSHKFEKGSIPWNYKGKNTKKQRMAQNRATLSDYYVRSLLKKQKKLIVPEMIELVRQGIIMKRTLKEFKKWRGEYESVKGINEGVECTGQGV